MAHRLERRIEHEILLALLRIVAKERQKDSEGVSDFTNESYLDDAVSEVVTDSGGAGDDVTTCKNNFPSLLSQLILKPLLDWELLELLRLVLNGDSFAIKALIEKLTNVNFSNDKRLAIVKILARAFERGNDGAEKVLTESLRAIDSKPELKHIKRSTLDAVLKASEYTAQYFNIIQPTFNPQPRPRYAPKSDSKKDDED